MSTHILVGQSFKLGVQESSVSLYCIYKIDFVMYILHVYVSIHFMLSQYIIGIFKSILDKKTLLVAHA